MSLNTYLNLIIIIVKVLFCPKTLINLLCIYQVHNFLGLFALQF